MATRKQILDNENNEILPITDTEAVRNPKSIGGTLESRISNIEKAIEDSAGFMYNGTNGGMSLQVWNGTEWLEIPYANKQNVSYGTTLPTENLYQGRMFFYNGVPIWYNGSDWVDATGTVVS